MKKRVLLILSCLFLSIGFLVAQTTKVTGVVIDDTGEPAVGVSVVVKGTTTGTITDADGNFTLNVPSGRSTLVFSLLGMKKVEVTASPSMRVTMQTDEATALDEVMVVAYGTAKKSAFTGSAGVVNADKLAVRSVSNITNALSGQVAGVQVMNTGGGQPGTAATIRIRGFGSMSASNAPLYVVDGVPFDGSISAINPNDIESMTVLKDAAANAIYGARGANGVILITTKKGSTKGTVVTVDTKWGSNSRAVPNYDVMDDPAMYYETFYRSLYNSKVYNGATPAAAYTFADNTFLDKTQGGLGYQIYTVPDGERIIGTNFKLNPNATLGYSDGQYYYTPDNWYDEVFGSDNLRQEYNLSVSGATDKINYYISAGYLDDTGLISGSGFTRFTGRAKVDAQAKKWLKVGANLGYTYYDLQSPGGQTSWGSSGNLFYVVNNVAPIYPLYVRNTDGTIKKDSNGYTVYDFGNTTNFARSYMMMANPAATLDLDKNHAYTDAITSNWFATITPFEGFKLTTSTGANVRNQRFNTLSNLFYGGSVADGGSVAVEHYREFAINQQLLASYNKTFNNLHNFDFLVGFEYYGLKVQDISGSNKKLFSPWVAEISNTIYDTPSFSSYTDNYKTQGFMSRVQYDYDGKYFASASYRRDASSRFTKDHRWGNFGSLGAAWLLSSEEFLKDFRWIDMLKFKASYGIQGNDALLYENGTVNYYPSQDQYQVSNNGSGDFAITRYYKGNPDITWETSYAFNTGFDFELFNRRLNGTLEYFSRKTKDLLYYEPQPLSAGYSTMPTNIGTIVNKGFEFDVNGIIFKNRDISATAFINGTHVSNEITDLTANLKEKGGQKGSNYIYRIGGSLYNSYLRRYAGVDQTTGEALYYINPDEGDWNTTSDYTKANQSDLGSTLPDIYGGFGFTVEAYGFDLTAQFAYQLGGKLYDGTYEALMHSGDNEGFNWHKDILKAWTPENPSSSIPRLSAADNTYQRQSDRFLASSDFLSLNGVVIGYTIPRNILSKLQIASLRIYVSGDNLALISTRKGFDPRTSFGLGSSTTSGNYRYSALKTISGGLNLTF